MHSEAICPRATCYDRCGKSSTDDNSLCSCDHRCQLLGDCCVDFSTECFNLAKLYPSKPYDSHSVNLAVIENSNAIGPEAETHRIVGYRHVDYCPKPYSLHEKCKNTDNIQDFRRLIPVCHPKSHVVFKNQYCAYCNGYHIDELVPFEFHVDIPSTCKELNIRATGSNKARISLEHMMEECGILRSLFVPQHCFGAVYRSKMYKRTDHAMCKSHLNPVIVTNSLAVYRNKHCLPEEITGTKCYNGEWPFSLPKNVTKEVSDIISLDSSGHPVLHMHVTAGAKTPRKCISFTLLLTIFAIKYFAFNWTLCTVELHEIQYLGLCMP